MKTSDFRTKATSTKLKEGMSKMFGVNVNFDNYSREQLEDIRNKLRTRVFQQEGKAGINDLLTNETYQKDKAMLALLNTRIKEMLGEQMQQLRDKMTQLSEAKKGVRDIKHSAKAKGAKPDFLDMDKDGDKKEPMKKAVADKKAAPKKGVNPFAKVKEGAKPDFLDMDKDGNKKEPMKKAVADKKIKEAAKWRDAEHKGKLYTQEPDDGEGDRHDYYRDSRPENDPGEKRSTFNRSKDTDKLHYPYGDYQVGQKARVGDRAKKGLLTKNAIAVVKNRIKGTHGDHPTPNLPEGFPTVDYDKVLNAIAALYGDDMWDNDAMQDLANDLEQAGPTDRELDFIIARGKLPKRLAGIQFSAGDDVQFNEGFPTVADAKKAHAEKGTASMKVGDKQKSSTGGEVTKTATGLKHTAGKNYGGQDAPKTPDSDKKTKKESVAYEGKDEGKPGKNFAKIAKSAGKQYGSKAAGERVAGAVRNKLAKQGKLQEANARFKHNVRFVNESLGYLLNEDEEGKAKAITSAGDMVNDFTSWMQRVGQYQTKTMIELADAIKADFGAAEAEAFKQAVGPALSATLETLTQQREAVSGAVAALAGEATPDVGMGMNPMAGGMEPGMDATAPDAMNPAPAGDEFGASDAAAGMGTTGREMRESRFARKLAESHSILAKLAK